MAEGSNVHLENTVKKSRAFDHSTSIFEDLLYSAEENSANHRYFFQYISPKGACKRSFRVRTYFSIKRSRNNCGVQVGAVGDDEN